MENNTGLDRIMVKNLIFYAFIIVAAISCKRPDKEPEFKYVTNIKVNKLSGEQVLLNAEAVFYNPNDMRMTLRGVDVDVYVEDKKVGKITQELKTKIPALDEFTVPFDATFNIKEVGVVNTLLSIMGGKELKVRYDGHIKVTVNGFPVRVNVDHENKVNFR